MDKLIKDIDRIYEGLQHLDIQPTKNNTTILLDTLHVLEAVYAHLQEEKQKDASKAEKAKEEEDGNIDAE